MGLRSGPHVFNGSSLLTVWAVLPAPMTPKSLCSLVRHAYSKHLNLHMPEDYMSRGVFNCLVTWCLRDFGNFLEDSENGLICLLTGPVGKGTWEPEFEPENLSGTYTQGGKRTDFCIHYDLYMGVYMWLYTHIHTQIHIYYFKMLKKNGVSSLMGCFNKFNSHILRMWLD